MLDKVLQHIRYGSSAVNRSVLNIKCTRFLTSSVIRKKTNTKLKSEAEVDTGRTTSPCGEREPVISDRKKSILVPKVSSTDHIQQKEVHTEGLFAGHKPLFLGDSSTNSLSSSTGLRGLFGTLAKIKKTEDDNGNAEVDIQGLINDLRNSNEQVQYDDIGRPAKPVIPWDASISGMVYNDDPFKHVPRKVVDRLRPFKPIRIERKSKSAQYKAPELIRLKFHNSKVNDEMQFIDIGRARNKRPINTDINEAASQSRLQHSAVINSLSQFKFVRGDQHVFKVDVDKLTSFLAKEFYKSTRLTIDSEFGNSHLPLYIYLDKSLSSRRLLGRYLRKHINEHIKPLLKTILSSYDSEQAAKKFELRVQLKVDSVVKNLTEYLPSVFFSGDVVDCVTHTSPVPSFGRIYWLKNNKRHSTFWGENINNDFVFNLNGDYKITRSGLRYMKYPITLQCKTFREAFTEWEDYT
ncbi:LADA_0E00562g1_1 [Lachancea dasiensis]|uniref:LADA_0E00562g1_1 n=1 Tax=Lachancea dasiensis TaxID=1072105 RepID=A0A1G4J9Y8_9SACH|nr:LADA_0E00562g1_1 [Lachancea dasiensis]